ncbi:hypothetical protein PROPEN_03430 [Proteus penneri ATCC 35198]|nr:hypothetical protein PROPEN_03430 [Proteus penneri ATCC 35198]
MNQSIQFPDREIWLVENRSVLFPIMINGMLLIVKLQSKSLLSVLALVRGFYYLNKIVGTLKKNLKSW